MSPRPVHRLFRSFLAIGVIAATACVDAPSTAPRFLTSEGASSAKQTPSGSKILVMRDDASGALFQVFSMSDDGTQLLQVTNFLFGFHPSWAPDGKRILFIGTLNSSSAADLASINSDGTGVTFLHLDALCPNWPVAFGKDILFVDGCTSTLYRVRTDGTGATPLLTGVCTGPVSPDAQARTVAVCRGFDIVLLDVVSGSVTNITNTPTSYEDEPAFSPNGKQLAFRRLATPNEAWVMNADGTNATLVAADAEFPHWSPDGKRIAFSRLDGPYARFDVFTMVANGTGITNITKSGVINEFVSAWTSY